MKKPTGESPDLTGCRTPEEMQGIALGWQTRWVVTGVSDPAKFFIALALVLPSNSFLYLEGTSISPALRTLLEEIQIEPIVQVKGGTIWPRPSIFHIPSTSEVLTRLHSLVKDCHGFEVCDHLHVYHGNTMLLQWFDAWDCPIGFSADFTETEVRQFCEATDGKIKPFDPKEF